MKPKERRDRLFKSSRPNIREMQLIDENGYTQDMKILWGAYKQGSFDLPDISQEEFAVYIEDQIKPYSKTWIVEDGNTKFSEGYGPVGMVCAYYNGWELEPHLEAFSWASPRNILRTAVSFFQMMRYNKDVGIVSVRSLKGSKGLFDHTSKYGVLKYLAKIPDGDERGDEYRFYIRGRKSAG